MVILSQGRATRRKRPGGAVVADADEHTDHFEGGLLDDATDVDSTSGTVNLDRRATEGHQERDPLQQLHQLPG